LRAWQIPQHGEPEEVLERAEVPRPVPGAGQLLVRVLVAAANFPDVLLCRGIYQVHPPLPFTLGTELCGEVAALGPGLSGFCLGDRVLGETALPHGAFAEYALMDAPTAMPAPATLDNAEAASFYVAYQAGWIGLVRRAQLAAAETLLVHAAAGGVGSAAVQIGKAAGARVIGVVGGKQKAALATELGADVVIDRHSQDFVAVVKEVTGGRGADVVFDPVGGDAFRRSTKCIAFEGRILVIGFASGDIPAAALNHALVKNYSILGLQGRTYRFLDPAAIRDYHDKLTKLVAAGSIRPLITERLPMDRIPDGLRRLAAGTTAGKIVFIP
jgi:NADPH:quinone reductase